MKLIQVLIYTFTIFVLTFDYYNTNELFIEDFVIGLVALLFLFRSVLLYRYTFKHKTTLEISLSLAILIHSFYGFYIIFASFLGYGFTGKALPAIFVLECVANVFLFVISIIDLNRLSSIKK